MLNLEGDDESTWIVEEEAIYPLNTNKFSVSKQAPSPALLELELCFAMHKKDVVLPELSKNPLLDNICPAIFEQIKSLETSSISTLVLPTKLC